MYSCSFYLSPPTSVFLPSYYYYYYWSLLCSAILRSRALTALACDSTWVNSFYSAFLNIHRSGVLTALAWLVPQESAARESQSWRVLCTPYNHAPCHFMQSIICKVLACLAASCNLRFWQNDRGLLRATAVTWGWMDTEIRVSTESWPWRRKFSRPSSRDSNPRPFDHKFSTLTTELSPLLSLPPTPTPPPTTLHIKIPTTKAGCKANIWT